MRDYHQPLAASQPTERTVTDVPFTLNPRPFHLLQERVEKYSQVLFSIHVLSSLVFYLSLSPLLSLLSLSHSLSLSFLCSGVLLYFYDGVLPLLHIYFEKFFNPDIMDTEKTEHHKQDPDNITGESIIYTIKFFYTAPSIIILRIIIW